MEKELIKLLRTTLARDFPDIKFKVKYEYLASGHELSVAYRSNKEINEITNMVITLVYSYKEPKDFYSYYHAKNRWGILFKYQQSC